MSQSAIPLFILLSLILTIGYYYKKAKRPKVTKPFPPAWRPILEQWVEFYRWLDDTDKRRFEQKMMRFLSYVKVTPVRCTLEDIDLVLISASAVIPMFNFKDWEYRNLKEVILYPSAFNEEFQTKGKGRNMLGLVGQTGPLKNRMILSQRSLRNGFQQKDKKNVGIHEFIHLLDMTDGKTDGIPEVIMQQPYIIPWIKLMQREIKNIQEEDSTIRDYGATNEAEFFSVVSEYFFGQPRQLKKKHPELYAILNKLYGYQS